MRVCSSIVPDADDGIRSHFVFAIQRDDGTWPSACTDEEFDLSLLDDLSDRLARDWPNIKALSPDAAGHTAFWEHGRWRVRCFRRGGGILPLPRVLFLTWWAFVPVASPPSLR